MPYYELGDEFWGITQNGTQLAIVAGSARASNARVCTFASSEQAETELAKLVAEKLAAGYVLADQAALRAARMARLLRPKDEPAPVVEEQNPELEAAIIANPYDEGAYSVYGDWLQSRGEPRGELIALQLAEKADPSPERTAASCDFLATHETLTRGLESCLQLTDHEGASAFVWRFGFIHRVSLIRSIDEDLSGDHPGEVASLFQIVLRHPSGRFVTEIRLRASSFNLASAIESIGMHAPQTMRALSLISGGWEGVETTLDPISHLPLTQLTLKTRPGDSELSAECLRSLARVPATLETLEVRFSGPEQIEHLASLFARTDLTALRELKLRGWAFAGEACRQLAASPFGRQLESIDLGLAGVEPSGLAMLADRVTFPKLRRVGLAYDQVSTKHRQPLEASGLELEDRRTDPDDAD